MPSSHPFGSRLLLAIVAVILAGFSSASMPPLSSLRWLEAPTAPHALKWAGQQTRGSLSRLRTMPEYPMVLADIESSLTASAPIPQVILLGPRALRFERSATHPYGLLQVARRGTAGDIERWRTVLDVGALRTEEGKPYELQWHNPKDMCLPPLYDRCLLRLSPSGGDEVELREFDLEKGQFVKGGFRAPASRAFAVWLDRNHVLIAHTLFGSPKTAAGWPAAVFDWSRGQSLKAAREVFEGSQTDAIMEIFAIGEGVMRRAIVLRAVNFSDFKLALIAANGRVTPVNLPAQLKPFGLLATSGHDLIVQLAEDADVNGHRVSAESLLAYDIAAQDPSRQVQVIYTPAAGWYLNDPLSGVAGSRQGVYFVVVHALVPHLFFAESRGSRWKISEVHVAKAGESLRLSGADPAGRDLIVQTSGFLTPTRQEVRGPTGQRTLLQEEKPAFDASKFVVESKSAVSRDGTSIDYLLLRPRHVRAGDPTPTLMTGYGAFGLTLTPDFIGFMLGGRAFDKVWLGRGGALAVPAMRGGGDRGEAWHRAAMRRNRQLSYDDFIAVSEALVKSGFTTPEHLGVFGTSNGGLLAAVMGTERPDLFGAVVSDVPLTDMLRFPKMGMGAAWIDEYGDPANPGDAKVLREYSPLQNVHAGTHYPPFLITTSTADNRVGPGHARKFAARLLEAGATVYFLEDQQGGHGVSDPLDHPEIMAGRMTFLIHYLMSHRGLEDRAGQL